MKERPNHRLYISVLRSMGLERRLKKAPELSEFSPALLWRGLEIARPELGAAELDRLYRARMEKAHSRAD